MGATIDCELEDGTARHFRIDAVGDTRSCLGAAVYYGFDGHYHGEFRGDWSSTVNASTTPPTQRSSPGSTVCGMSSPE